MVRKAAAEKPHTTAAVDPRQFPLSALLSQILVAFTIEFDNEFELRMAGAGYPGVNLSFMIWANLIRLIPAEGVTVGDLASRAYAGENCHALGCLERWRFVVLEGAAPGKPAGSRAESGNERRDGWGSGRGIRRDWTVRLTRKGRTASEIWAALPSELEERWRSRFGEERIARLRSSLRGLVDQFELELPWGLPADWLGEGQYPKREKRVSDEVGLLSLLSQVLLAFALEYNRESKTPIALAANVVRVLGDKPVRSSEIPRLTGTSPEQCAIGWRFKPYVTVERDPKLGRGTVARLTDVGKRAKKKYERLTKEIEQRWREKFCGELREALVDVLLARCEGKLCLSAGMVPPVGVIRSGVAAPALGRKKVASAARQRGKDLVAQSAEFVRDPIGALPHYPLWDMNRGFGP